MSRRDDSLALSTERRERRSFAKIPEVLDVPNLIAIQRDSFQWFLSEGLAETFRDMSPIEDFTRTLAVEFGAHEFGEPKYSVEECKEKDMSFQAPLFVEIRFINKETGEIKEQSVFMGDFPLMTDRGTFVINGTERVVVSQLVRSPGVYFAKETDKTSDKQVYSAKVIPARGAWLEIETDRRDIVSVRIDRKRKQPATILLKALGIAETREEIEEMFGHSEAISNTLARDVTETREEALLEIYKRLRPGEPPTVESARSLLDGLFFNAQRYDLAKVGRYKVNKKLGLSLPDEQTTLTAEDIKSAVEYLIRLWHGDEGYQEDDIDHFGNRRIRSVGELIQNQFRIGLARMERVVRERMTTQDVNEITPQSLINIRPIVASIKEFFGSSQLSQFMDQTNPVAGLTHKRRLSALGPGGLSRERAGFEVRDVHPSHYGRMCPIETPEGPNIGLIGSLATFAQINRYGFIETPYRKVEKGKVTDQIDYLTADEEERHVIAQANEPFDAKTGKFLNARVLCRVKGQGPGGQFGEPEERIPAEVTYMDVSPRQMVSVATALIPFLEHDDANRALMGSNMQRQAVPLLRAAAPLVGTGLEHRAIMDTGEVVLSKLDGVVREADAEHVFVGPADSFERFVELRDGLGLIQPRCAELWRLVQSVGSTADQSQRDLVLSIFGECERELRRLSKQTSTPVKPKSVEEAQTRMHQLTGMFQRLRDELGALKRQFNHDLPKYKRSNQGTCINHRARAAAGQKVTAGQALADAASTEVGELALGQNLLVAFMPWEGYNYEDAIIISERVVKEDLLTSIHIEEYEVEARETKLGAEEITREIPNIGEELLTDLDLDGVIRIGAEVHPGDVLVGKVTPKGETELTPEERLLRAIFGEKSHEVRDTSLRVPHGETGRVIGVSKLSRERDENPFREDTGHELNPGVNELVRVYVAQKRKIQEGDKLAGRHGNKGVIAKILPVEDMPFLADGTPVDIILNPLGVPSRMNIGQLLETHLGWAAAVGWSDDPKAKESVPGPRHVATPVFDGARESEILDVIEAANRNLKLRAVERFGKKANEVFVPNVDQQGKTRLFDGRTGEPFREPITVGQIYILKLLHLVDDKIHARSTGPYSLITQQPLGGKAQFGGQRFGEMEVWALYAYGAAYVLQEILTIKSDDVLGRVKAYEMIVKGESIPEPGIPESFKVLFKEMQSLCLDVEVIGEQGETMELKERDEDLLSDEVAFELGMDEEPNMTGVDALEQLLEADVSALDISDDFGVSDSTSDDDASDDFDGSDDVSGEEE